MEIPQRHGMRALRSVSRDVERGQENEGAH